MFSRRIVLFFLGLVLSSALANANQLSDIQDQILEKKWESAQLQIFELLAQPRISELEKESAFSLYQLLPSQYRCQVRGTDLMPSGMSVRFINFQKDGHPAFLVRVELTDLEVEGLEFSLGSRLLPLMAVKTQSPEVISSFESGYQTRVASAQVVTMRFTLSGEGVVVKFPWRLQSSPSDLPELILPVDGGVYTNEDLTASWKGFPYRKSQKQQDVVFATAITSNQNQDKALFETRSVLASESSASEGVFKLKPAENATFEPLEPGEYKWNFQFVKTDTGSCVKTYSEWLSSRRFQIKAPGR